MIRNFLHHWWLRNRYGWAGDFQTFYVIVGSLIIALIYEVIIWRIFDIHWAGDPQDFAQNFFHINTENDFVYLIAYLMVLFGACIFVGAIDPVQNFFDNLHIPNGKIGERNH